MIYVLSLFSYACLMNLLTILFYFISLVSTEMPSGHTAPPRYDPVEFIRASGNEVIYDNFTASHMIALEASSDRT